MEKHVLDTAVEEFCLHCAAGLCTGEEGIISANVCVVKDKERKTDGGREGGVSVCEPGL